MKNAFGSPKSTGRLGNVLDRSRSLSGATHPADAALDEATQRVRSLPLHALVPNARQPRRHFKQESLDQLALSLREKGVLQPLMARPLPGESGRFEIVYGERRWRAAHLAGLDEVPVIVRELVDSEADLLAAVENLQREDLNRYDEVTYKLRLVAVVLGTTPEDAITQLKALRAAPHNAPEQVAELDALFEQLGRESWRSFVTNGLPALRLPETLKAAVQSGALDYTKALVIARAPAEHHEALLRRTLDEDLTHADLSKAVGDLKTSLPVQGDAHVAAQVRRKLSPRTFRKLPAERQAQVSELLRQLDRLLTE